LSADDAHSAELQATFMTSLKELKIHYKMDNGQIAAKG